MSKENKRKEVCYTGKLGFKWKEAWLAGKTNNNKQKEVWKAGETKQYSAQLLYRESMATLHVNEWCTKLYSESKFQPPPPRRNSQPQFAKPKCYGQSLFSRYQNSQNKR